MATLEEKKRQLAKLLRSKALAESVFQAAEQTEKAAVEMGLTYKAQRESLPFAPRDYNVRAGIGTVLRGK